MYTNKVAILWHLYLYRYTTRPFIQQALKHKHVSRVQKDLEQLVDKGYIYQFPRQSVIHPYLYTLTSPGFKHLVVEASTLTQHQFINNTAKNLTLSHQFQHACLYTAEIALALETLASAHLLTLSVIPKQLLKGLDDLPDPLPTLLVKKRSSKDYCIEVFPENAWKSLIQNRIRQYMNYYDEQDVIPETMFILNSDSKVKIAKRYAEWCDEENAQHMHFLKHDHQLASCIFSLLYPTLKKSI